MLYVAQSKEAETPRGHERCCGRPRPRPGLKVSGMKGDPLRSISVVVARCREGLPESSRHHG